MSKTDLHFRNPWEFEDFCYAIGWKLTYHDCDHSWGSGSEMIKDFRRRIPLALKDGNLTAWKGIDTFLEWLNNAIDWFSTEEFCGATAVYRIDL